MQFRETRFNGAMRMRTLSALEIVLELVPYHNNLLLFSMRRRQILAQPRMLYRVSGIAERRRQLAYTPSQVGRRESRGYACLHSEHKEVMSQACCTVYASVVCEHDLSEYYFPFLHPLLVQHFL